MFRASQHVSCTPHPLVHRCWVVAAAQAGRHNEKRESYGHSIVVDPWGRIAARLDDPLAEGIAVAEIDLGALRAVRQRMPVAEHRRRGRPAVQEGGAARGGGDEDV